MNYIGENNYFSFRDGGCEEKNGREISAEQAIFLGKILSGIFSRFSIGCSGFENLPLIYSLSSSISECGKDVYICENTDFPSFRFGCPLISSDCGIYARNNKITFCDRNGFIFSDIRLTEIMNGRPAKKSVKYGRISSFTSFRDIYINNIADTLNVSTAIPAGISCGDRSVRSLWLEFFTGDDDDFVFQISDDGNRVNAYSTEYGFIPYEKLMLCFCVLNNKNSDNTVYLPWDMHYSADYAENINVKRFDYNDMPPQAVKQRFLKDSLYMCTHIAENRYLLGSIIKKLPSFASARRDIVSDFPEKNAGRTIESENGRIIVGRSGKNRISLTAQAYSSETAAELCAEWSEKLMHNN
ncbi:MAG: hypothetical protein IKS03_02400 [Ruminococcus sp.]|nr:hypothetical protein [Ruminococcus sp.]